VRAEYDKWGLKINLTKTEHTCTGRDTSNSGTENEVIKKCESFKYLRPIVRTEGSCDKDIETRTAMGKRGTGALHGSIWNHKITQETKKRIFHRTVENKVLHAAEMWQQITKI
jgi:hypothetical protein